MKWWHWTRRLGNKALFESSFLLGKTRVWGLPDDLMIEPASVCNLGCPTCPTGAGTLNRPGALMDFDLYRKIIDELWPTTSKIRLWNLGEPFMHKDIYRMIRYAKDRFIKILTSTNGHYFREPDAPEKVVNSGLDFMIVSMDGATQESLEKFRIGARLDRIVEGVKSVIEHRDAVGAKNPTVEFQFIAMKHNIHEIAEARVLAKTMKTDIFKLKTIGISANDPHADELIREYLPEDARYSRYPDAEAIRNVANHIDKLDCKRPWRHSVINQNGDVVACCYDDQSHYVFGNLREMTFRQIWNGERYVRFRRGLLKGRSHLKTCAVCTEGLPSSVTP